MGINGESPGFLAGAFFVSRNLLKLVPVFGDFVSGSSIEYARRRAGSGQYVQLFDVGAACSSGTSFAGDPRPDGWRASVVGPGVGQAVRGHGPCVGRSRVWAAGAAVAGALFDPFGAPVGRADRLQPALPLVRRPGHG